MLANKKRQTSFLLAFFLISIAILPIHRAFSISAPMPHSAHSTAMSEALEMKAIISSLSTQHRYNTVRASMWLDNLSRTTPSLPELEWIWAQSAEDNAEIAYLHRAAKLLHAEDPSPILKEMRDAIATDPYGNNLYHLLSRYEAAGDYHNFSAIYDMRLPESGFRYSKELEYPQDEILDAILGMPSRQYFMGLNSYELVDTLNPPEVWFERAAKQGYSEAVPELAHIYYKRDEAEEGYFWCLISLEIYPNFKDPEIAPLCKEMRQKLSAHKRAHIEREAKEEMQEVEFIPVLETLF